MKNYIKELNFIFVILVCVHQGGSFLPTRLSAVSDNDQTMEDIIREGIYRVLLKTEEKELAFGYVDFDKADTKLLLEVWGQLERSISEIVDSCNLVDINFPGLPVWSFANEQIMEGHELLLSLRERLLQTVGSAKPLKNDEVTTYQRTSTASLTAARETLGHIFHLVLMFYSNTNWLELGHQEMYKSLGMLSRPLIPVCPKSFPTCEACGENTGHSCANNLLGKDFLTSGYIGTRQHASESPMQLEERYGKCRHGGTRQDGWNNMTVSGGINKQSADPRLSPHYMLHDKAAQLAIKHVAFYLEDQDYGLRHLLGDAQFNRLFFSDREIDDKTLPRKRRDLSGMDFYHLIADTSGGTVYKTDKNNIGAVVDIIKDSVSTKPPVTVMKFKQLATSSDTFEVPVDELINNLTIKVQNPLGVVSSMNLYRPDGTQQTFGNPLVASQQQLGRQLIVIKLYNPTPGIWRMERTASAELDIDVTASTDLEFTYTFMQAGPGGLGEYPLTGRPIAGDNTTVQVFVPKADALSSVDSLLLLDRNGALVDNATIHNVGGRRGKTLFKTYVVLPSKEFEIAIEGKDKSGNKFRRLDPKMISTLDIQLKVLPTSGTLYVNETISLPYQIRNVGGGSATIHVAISDDKGFAQSPLNHSHIVSSGGTANGAFTLHAGPLKGETTTVTISAKIDGSASNKVQYSVQRITVEERVIRVFDKKAPICNVTSTSGLCNFGSDVCQCSSHTWEMSAVVGDDGDGLQSVFASNAGNSSTFTVDTFSPGKNIRDGLVHARIRADCCHQQAKITVVDLAGNVGLCEVTITPGFVAPDPKLCLNPAKQQPASPSVNATKISCNVTQVDGSCNGSSANSSNWCEGMFWNLHAVLGSEGFGRIQVAPVNAGMQANLTRTNNTLILSTDCCHSDVYINAVDIVGNTGQCHATITVDNRPNSSAQQSGSSSSIAIIAGSAAGGVVAVVGITVLAIFLKKRLASSVIQPRAEPTRTKY